MPIDTREMRADRRKLILEARSILDKADKEKRKPTAEEEERYQKAWSDKDELQAKIDDAERRNDLEREEILLSQSQEEEDRRKKAESGEDKQSSSSSPLGSEEYHRAFEHRVYGDKTTLSDEEQRALSAGTGTEGGYLYASEKFVDQIIADVTDACVFRQFAKGLTISNTDSLGVPTLTNRMADAAWTSELGIPSTDSTLAFGKRALTPHPLAKEIRVSKVLLRKVPKAQAIVRSELARVVAEVNEAAFMTGSGAQQPLGIFTASADGIPAARDVSTGNTDTSPTFDGLKRAKYSIKQVYWPNLRWLFHRDVAAVIALLKDGNGRYLWQDSVVQGEPDRVLGFPATLSEYAPNTLTTGLYVGILGDFSDYWIVDSMAMQIARAEEIYIRENQDLFVIRMETDGAPMRSEGFARVKLA